MNTTSTQTIQTATVNLAATVMAAKGLSVEDAAEYVINQMITTNPGLAVRPPPQPPVNLLDASEAVRVAVVALTGAANENDHATDDDDDDDDE